MPFPDGKIIVRLAWSYVPSEEKQQSLWPCPIFRCPPPINVQLMVKDSRKYAATAGWGFGQFKDG
jgi:hypothetical protein